MVERNVMYIMTIRIYVYAHRDFPNKIVFVHMMTKRIQMRTHDDCNQILFAYVDFTTLLVVYTH